ncbi:nucleotide-binding universal stress UspA family protein [Actinoplanes octamycinicus]|uniref:Nucleotide-binding universal stress UspA family protein n=1 Tax=Actinoplanes octamycinicus TaxID=135948 RepID=A0A7W7MA92_9ACTN|nr:universal stress protein [Actinoplanes octamycinicus]MBB4742742.1 nucleotide-binding universal stress UspA family protein [Actinoplanes octamycinicus]GIE63042.1 universal stress protein [Actinoplanes octamycinicus]
MDTSSVTPVVAGVSGSPASMHAVEAAAREAGAHGHPLRLVHALSYRPDVFDQPRAAGDLLRHAKAVAERTTPGLRVTTELVEGHPLNGLLRLSRHAALTVVGDGGLNDRVCLPRDATAVQIAARAFGTVMVTRPMRAPHGPVLVGVNGADIADPVLDYAFEVAARRRTGLVVVHVGETADRMNALRDAIDARARQTRVDANFCTLSGDPSTVLRQESQQASLIVVGARGELPYHGLLGSVAQTLLHHGRGPVVVVRAHRSADRRADTPPALAGRPGESR